MSPISARGTSSTPSTEGGTGEVDRFCPALELTLCMFPARHLSALGPTCPASPQIHLLLSYAAFTSRQRALHASTCVTHVHTDPTKAPSILFPQK